MKENIKYNIPTIHVLQQNDFNYDNKVVVV